MSEDELYERLCDRWHEGGPVTAQQYTQRQYQPGELDAIGNDLIAEAKKRRDTA